MITETAVHHLSATELLGSLPPQGPLARRGDQGGPRPHRPLGALPQGHLCPRPRRGAGPGPAGRGALVPGCPGRRPGRRAGHDQGEHRDPGRGRSPRHGGDGADAGRGRCAAGGPAARGGRGHPGQDHHARSRHAVLGPLQLSSAYPQPLGSQPESRRLQRRGGSGGGGRLRPARISAPTSAARCACRPAGAGSSR